MFVDQAPIQEKHIEEHHYFAVNSYQERTEKILQKRKILAEKRRAARAVSPSKNHVDPFGNGITITGKDMGVIASIINFLDSKSTLALGWPSNQKHVINLGNQINHVHPLCFIWTIVSNNDLRNKVKSFRDNSLLSLKWNGFLGLSAFHNKGFCKNMSRYYDDKDPTAYEKEFQDFCRALNLKEDEILPIAKRKNWKLFASKLLDLVK